MQLIRLYVLKKCFYVCFFNTDDMELVIRFGMTTYVRHIGRYVDLPAVLKDLEVQGVLSENKRLAMALEDDKEEQASVLVMHMLDETKENLLKFCRCIRKIQPVVSDLIENSSDDGKSIGEIFCFSFWSPE